MRQSALAAQSLQEYPNHPRTTTEVVRARRRVSQLKTWPGTVLQEMEVDLGPSVFGVRRWWREWIELSMSAAADRHAWRITIRNMIETLALSYMAGVVSCFHRVNYILFCLIMTAGVTLCVSLAAIACPIDITKCQFLLAVLSIIFLIFSLVCIIVFVCGGYTRVLHAVYGGVGAVLFSIYLAYDTQMLIGGHRYELSPEDYIVGAMDLFVDVMEIFFSLVALFNESE
ncbi:unnamed protein product [Schistocephalus solidus]|uniref:Protein lifeguard 2 n=2 Tax=Schistocephalus solidus TaxID=70667 RepID=A0A183T2Z6_SCHSO|nr:unnamed protein product [Schistocephalus solidus]